MSLLENLEPTSKTAMGLTGQRVFLSFVFVRLFVSGPVCSTEASRSPSARPMTFDCSLQTHQVLTAEGSDHLAQAGMPGLL